MVYTRHLFVLLFCLLAFRSVSATHRYVSTSGSATGSATSWQTASNDLQAIMNASVAGDTIWITAGVFTPARDITGNASPVDPRTKTFVLKSGVVLIGGFAGIETSPAQRTPVEDSLFTILSGPSIKSYHVVTALGTPSAPLSGVLDKIKIQRGQAIGAGTADTRGAGVYARHASLTFRYCSISDNGGDEGAGIFADSCNLAFFRCTISKNSKSFPAATIGAIYLRASQMVMHHSHLYNNGITGSSGGAIMAKAGSVLTVYNTLIDGNTASSGVGAVIDSSLATFTNCTMTGNTALGTLLLARGGNGLIAIRNCIIKFNSLAGLSVVNGGTITQASSVVAGTFPGSVDGNVLWSGSFEPQCTGSQGVLNRGDTTFIPADIFDSDADGNVTEKSPLDYTLRRPRVLADTVDMGVYESFKNMPTASRMYVNQASTGGDGTSWATAFTSLSHALDHSNCTNGALQEIWVAEGVYRPGGPQQANQSFSIPPGTDLYGGFAGTETTLGQRNIAAHPTILSGENQQDNWPNNNSRPILYLTANSNETVVDGMIFREGLATSTQGVINIAPTLNQSNLNTPVVKNCVFTQNYGSAGYTVFIDGNNGGFSPLFDSCQIINNQCAAILMQKGTSGQAKPTFRHCTINGNGGNYAIFVDNDVWSSTGSAECIPTFEDCHLQASTSVIRIRSYALGAGITLNRCVVKGDSLPYNTSLSKHGIQLELLGSGSVPFGVTANDCKFLNLAGYGIAVAYSSSVSLAVDRSIFVANNGLGGISVAQNSSGGKAKLMVRNSLFSGGIPTVHSTTMAGIFINASIGASPAVPGLDTVLVNGCTFLNGISGGTNAHGVKINLSGTVAPPNPITITNCIFKAASVAAGVTYNPNLSVTTTVAGYTPTISSNLYNLTPAIAGTNNRAAVPVFVDATNPVGPDGLWGTPDDGYHLTCISPGADGAPGAAMLPGDSLDLAGTPRIQNAGMNIGAYETLYPDYQTTRLYVKPGTLNGSGTAWTDPLNTLTGAINQLSCTRNAQAIWVAAGTYLPAQDTSGNSAPADPRAKTFALPGGVSLYGGFAGNESSLQARSLVTNRTILSGNTGDPLLTTDNSYHVVTLRGRGTTELNGITLADGNATGTNGYDQSGGGLLVASDSATNVNIRYGIISGNRAVYGGGIAIQPQDSSSRIQLSVQNSVFALDSAGVAGGALHWQGNAHATTIALINNTLYGNMAGVNGGVAATPDTAVTDTFRLWNSLCWANTAVTDSLFALPAASTDFQYCLTQGAAALPGSHNMAETPMLFQPASPRGADGIWGTLDDGLHLTCLSPGDDEGNTALLPTPQWDIAGQTRLQGRRVNIGAFETLKTSLVPTKIYVSATADGNGRSWAAATPDLGEALKRCDCAPNVTEIWVTGGSYQPTSDTTGNRTPTNARTKTFRLRNGVSIWGGFAGGETTRAARPAFADPFSSSTVLSGDIGTIGDSTDNAYHVITASNLASSSNRLDRLRITEGSTAPGAGNSSTYLGGGMYAPGTTMRLSHCTFDHNRGRYGAGLYINRGVRLDTCRFDHNYSIGEGGGVYSVAVVLGASPVFRSCVFEGNKAQEGGGVYNKGGAVNNQQLFLNCIFSQNKATLGSGGAIYNWAQSDMYCTPIFHNCLVINNTATEYGGGFYHDGGNSNYRFVYAKLYQCTVYGNHAGLFGGGMCTRGNPINGMQVDAPTTTNCIFYNNSAIGNTGSFYHYETYGVGSTIILQWANNNDCIDLDVIGIAAGIAPQVVFANPTDPDGADNQWLTPDDGFALAGCSPYGVDDVTLGALPADVVDADKDGNLTEFLPLDITGAPRVIGVVNHGAYETTDPTAGGIPVTASATQVCAGANVTLTATGTGPFTWTGGVQNGVAFSPQATASYGVTVASGQLCATTITITVDTSAKISLVSPSQDVCTGNSVTLTALSQAPVSWSGGVANGVSFIPTTTQTYTASTAANGCTDTALVSLPVWQLPSVQIQASSPVLCEGAPLILSGLGAATYSWSGGIQNGVAFPVVAGTSFTVTGTDIHGCTDTATFQPGVWPLPQVVITSSISAMCSGVQAVVSASATPAGSITWSGGVANGVPFTPAIGSVYTASTTDGNGCTGSADYAPLVLPLPVVAVTPTPATVCAGANMALTAIANIPSMITWAGGIQNGVPFVPVAGSSYTASATDAYGCTGSISYTPVVHPLPVITATATPNIVCNGSPVSIIATATAPVTYTLPPGIANGVPFVPAASATYLITGTTAQGCAGTDTASFSIAPLPVPILNVQGDSACAGNLMTLTASTATPATLSWNSGILNGVPFVPTPGIACVVTATDGLGCKDSLVFTPVVYPLPQVLASASDDSLCAGQSLTLQATGAPALTWNAPGVQSGVPFVPGQSATYAVTGMDGNGCAGADSITVVVVDPALTLAQAPPAGVCAGTAVTLQASSAGTIDWNHNVINGIAFTPDSTRIYQAISTLWGCSDTLSVPVMVWQLPGAQVVLSGADTLLTLNSSNTASFEWLLNGQPLPDTSTVLPQPLPGSYSVMVISPEGCRDTSAAFVFTAISHPLPEMGGIFPNPTTGAFAIRHRCPVRVIELYDMQGKRVFASEVSTPAPILHLYPTIPVGVYSVFINQQEAVYRVIITE